MKKLLISLISLCLLFTIAELIVRRYKPQITFTQAYQNSIKCFKEDDILPFSLLRDSKCQMKQYYGEYDTSASINSFGYRGKEFNIEKQNGVKRILVLGDSMAFGIGVNDNQTFPYYLEEILNEKGTKTEVINAGFADGFSPDSFYLYLKERGLKLEPDVIILALFIYNDIADLSETVWEEVDDKGLPVKISSCCRVVDNGLLRGRKIILKYKYPVLRESHLFKLFAGYMASRIEQQDLSSANVAKRDRFQGCALHEVCLEANFSEEEGKIYKVIREIARLANEREIEFVVAILPVDYQLYSDTTAKYGTAIYLPSEENKTFLQQRIAEKLTLYKIQYIDLYPAFDKQRERGYPYFKSDAHFNKLGNKITAETLAEFLMKKAK